MSSTYNGDGATPALVNASPVDILSSTNASPIEITTATPHGFVDGDYAQIIGHTVNTSANGYWTITLTGASSFTLNGSTGVGVGGATGQAQDYAVGPLVTLPGDGDLANATSVNIPNESNADFIPFVAQRLGGLNLHAIYSRADFTSQTNTYSSTALSTGVWVDLTNLTTLLSSQGDRYIQTGDVFDIRFGTTIELARLAGVIRYAMGIGVNVNGGATAVQSGSVRVIQLDNAISTVDYMPVELSCIVSGLTANDRIDVTIAANKDSAAALTLALKAGYSLTVHHYRSNA
jgi:hypothetical protein